MNLLCFQCIEIDYPCIRPLLDLKKIHLLEKWGLCWDFEFWDEWVCCGIVGKVMQRASEVVYHVIYVDEEDLRSQDATLGNPVFTEYLQEINPSRWTCSEQSERKLTITFNRHSQTLHALSFLRRSWFHTPSKALVMLNENSLILYSTCWQVTLLAWSLIRSWCWTSRQSNLERFLGDGIPKGNCLEGHLIPGTI